MGKFVVKKTSNDGFVFNLIAGNGQVIGTSQTYSTKKTALAGIESVKKNAGSDIEDQTLAEPVAVKNPKWEIYNDKAGEFRFRLKASNGEIILASQGYSSKASCKNGIESVKTNAPEAEVEVLEE